MFWSAFCHESFQFQVIYIFLLFLWVSFKVILENTFYGILIFKNLIECMTNCDQCQLIIVNITTYWFLFNFFDNLLIAKHSWSAVTAFKSSWKIKCIRFLIKTFIKVFIDLDYTSQIIIAIDIYFLHFKLTFFYLLKQVILIVSELFRFEKICPSWLLIFTVFLLI